MYGYQLRTSFERSTGSVWPLNVGQVYTTLARLERDGLVQRTGESDNEGKVVYRLTEAGHAEHATWFATPVAGHDRPRDELAVKVALAVTTPGVDARAVIRTQRSETSRHLDELTRSKVAADNAGDTAGRLVCEAMIFRAEAEIRWLDHTAASDCASAVRRA